MKSPGYKFINVILGNSASNFITKNVFFFQLNLHQAINIQYYFSSVFIHVIFVETYITTPQPTPNPCDSKQGFKSYGNDCLLYASSPMAWTQANQYCQTKGAFLATVSGVFEQAYLFLTINDLSVVTKTATWIGLKDASVSVASFRWKRIISACFRCYWTLFFNKNVTLFRFIFPDLDSKMLIHCNRYVRMKCKLLCKICKGHRI